MASKGRIGLTEPMRDLEGRLYGPEHASREVMFQGFLRECCSWQGPWK